MEARTNFRVLSSAQPFTFHRTTTIESYHSRVPWTPSFPLSSPLSLPIIIVDDDTDYIIIILGLTKKNYVRQGVPRREFEFLLDDARPARHKEEERKKTACLRGRGRRQSSLLTTGNAIIRRPPSGLVLFCWLR